MIKTNENNFLWIDINLNKAHVEISPLTSMDGEDLEEIVNQLANKKLEGVLNIWGGSWLEFDCIIWFWDMKFNINSTVWHNSNLFIYFSLWIWIPS